MIELYHFALSTCSQKVRLVLVAAIEMIRSHGKPAWAEVEPLTRHSPGA